MKFSQRLRQGTSEHHANTETSPFIGALLNGRLDQTAYVRMLGQLRFVYDALERGATALADDPLAGVFVDPRLFRTDAITDDLDVLAGGDWRDGLEPNSATRAYCDRIDEVRATWPAGFVAHHYTRYLGDLSGGVFVGRAVESLYGVTPTAGARFYAFDAIGDANEYKVRYREHLDATPWDVPEQMRVIDEVRQAYSHNDALFASLDTYELAP